MSRPPKKALLTEEQEGKAREFAKDVADHPEKYDKGPFSISVAFLDLKGEDRNGDSNTEGLR